MEPLHLYIAIAGLATIAVIGAFFVIRHYVHISGIKKCSKLYAALMTLNDKYRPLFHGLPGVYNAVFVCNSLQKYKNNNNPSSITKYLSGYVRENEKRWRELFAQAQSNRAHYEKYMEEYGLHKKNLAGTSHLEIKKKMLLSEKHYKKLEEKICEKNVLKATIRLDIYCTISYTSPKGQNHYSNGWFVDLGSILANIDKINESEQSIEYQRTLMTSSKRYDILKRDNFMCKICGRTAEDGAKLEVDHIIPVSKGGKTKDSNLQTLCRECNQGKKAKI